MTYAVGSLVKARGREWVVLPESNEELLVVRPLGGTDDEVTLAEIWGGISTETLPPPRLERTGGCKRQEEEVRGRE